MKRALVVAGLVLAAGLWVAARSAAARPNDPSSAVVKLYVTAVARDLSAPWRPGVNLGRTEWPSGPGSGGSTTAPSLGPCARAAAEEARAAILGKAAPGDAAAWTEQREEVGFHETDGGRRFTLRAVVERAADPSARRGRWPMFARRRHDAGVEWHRA